MGRYLGPRLDSLWFCGSDVVDASVILTPLVFTGEKPLLRASLYCAGRMFLGERANASPLFQYAGNTLRSLEVGFKKGVISYVRSCQ